MRFRQWLSHHPLSAAVFSLAVALLLVVVVVANNSRRLDKQECTDRLETRYEIAQGQLVLALIDNLVVEDADRSHLAVQQERYRDATIALQDESCR